MDRFIDLHIHSDMSDGSFSPEDLISFAAKQKISLISITDHNTFEGVEDAIYYGKQKGVDVLAGVEISADYTIDIHLLAFFPDERFLQLQGWISDLRYGDIEEKIHIVLEKAANLGYKIPQKSFGRVLKENKPCVYRVFDFLTEAGYFDSPLEAEIEAFAYGKNGYTEGLFTPLEIIRIVKEYGGRVFLAHPFKYGLEDFEVDKLLEDALIMGVDGIEVYHSEATSEEIKHLEEFVKKHNLLCTGGSDFHGEIKPDVDLGFFDKDKRFPYEIAQKMFPQRFK
jgi:predicted metal-dependent phosphoesterase TrpH